MSRDWLPPTPTPYQWLLASSIFVYFDILSKQALLSSIYGCRNSCFERIRDIQIPLRSLKCVTIPITINNTPKEGIQRDEPIRIGRIIPNWIFSSSFRRWIRRGRASKQRLQVGSAFWYHMETSDYLGYREGPVVSRTILIIRLTLYPTYTLLKDYGSSSGSRHTSSTCQARANECSTRAALWRVGFLHRIPSLSLLFTTSSKPEQPPPSHRIVPNLTKPDLAHVEKQYSPRTYPLQWPLPERTT